MQTQYQTPKLLYEFSLLPQGKERLQAFFKENFAAFNEKTQRKLHELLKEILPVESQEMLAEMLAGRRAHALLIHNFPERPGLEHMGVYPRSNYSFHIGNALYAMNGARHHTLASDYRASHQSSSDDPVGLQMHRDTLLEEGKRGQYVLFSCPYNGEDALTEIIHLQRAILQVPLPDRLKIRVSITSLNDDIPGMRYCTLEQAYEMIMRSNPNNGFITHFVITSDLEAPATRNFIQAIESNSVKVNLQPGDVLAINENKLFHRAHRGTEAIVPSRQRWSRIVLHNSGRNVQGKE